MVNTWQKEKQTNYFVAGLYMLPLIAKLVGGFNPSGKILVSWDDYSQYMENNTLENQKILEYSRLLQYQSTQKWACTSKESQFREI